MAILYTLFGFSIGLVLWLWVRNRELSKRQEGEHQKFELVANRILQDSTLRLTQTQEQLLAPLRERLSEFAKKVDDSYQTEARERFALKREIERLVELNQKVSLDATQLTQALKGDNKSQGDWGEVQLVRVLEQAGLREGVEYVTQAKELDLRDEQGARLRPDVVVLLPEKKHLIIDAKVSLNAYHQSVQAVSEADRQRALKDHVQSLRAHVDGLSKKHYPLLSNIDSPDFVLLFMPIEPALSEALKFDPQLSGYAWERKVAIASPTLLFAFLRTIASLWSRERQAKNALVIAEEGGKLYDKFVSFVADLDRIGKSLSDAQGAFDESMSKLRDGKGNLIGRVEKLRELGAKTKKQLNENQRSMQPDDRHLFEANE